MSIRFDLLDSMIAEHIFGWQWCHRVGDASTLYCFPPDRPLLAKDRYDVRSPHCLGPVGDFEIIQLTDEQRGWTRSGDILRFFYSLPKYSRCGDHAIQILEAMRKRNVLYSVAPCGIEEQKPWCCKAWVKGSLAFCYAETIEEAVAVAAVCAVTGKSETELRKEIEQ